jgi:putative pyruvate formate lyase activating enzyme
LRCSFCQNWQISREGMGREVTAREFADICLELQRRGAENINIVTGSHVIPQLAEGLAAARSDGLTLPVLWNSSGYESVAALELIEPYIDVWLPDLKTLNPDTARRFFNAPDYPDAAEKAVTWMLGRPVSPRFSLANEDTGKPCTVMLRHLALPGLLDDTRAVLRWFAGHAAGRALLSLMTQYTPIKTATDTPARFINEAEYDGILGMLDEIGEPAGFYQELETGDAWLPDFARKNPFSSELSNPVWHWWNGFTEF